MSLQPPESFPVPEDSRRVAQAAFPKGTLCLRIGDHLGTIYQDSQFTAVFPARGQPAEAPARLALVTVLQFIEGLSDRQAADAVRGRLDWNYILGLELTDPGFNFRVLSEFRARLLAGKDEAMLLNTLVVRLQERGLLKARGRQRTDSTHGLAAVRVLNRLERVGETLRAALNSLAVAAPEGLQACAPAVWYERSGPRVENYQFPKSEAARQQLAAAIGADGRFLLAAVEAAIDQPWLQTIPAIETLRRVWKEPDVEPEGAFRWRTVEEMPTAAEQVCSPYAPEVRYSTQRSVEGVGYKVHLTETGDPQTPHVIVNVETTPASTPDDNMAEVVHASLAERRLLPTEHLVDKGYPDAQVLLDSQRDYQVTITGPVAEDPSWQARDGTGFDKSHFIVAGDRQVVTCPAGKQSVSWLRNTDPKTGVRWEARCARQDCTPCPFRAQCTRAKVEPRIMGLQPQEQHEVLQAARKPQTTAQCREQDAARAGIESTQGQAIRRCGLRQSRYSGLAKTHLQHIITAVAVNLVRLGEWWNGIPTAPTRCSRSAALSPSIQPA
jgi:transposase